jgi:prepilin peptidase CpaA
MLLISVRSDLKHSKIPNKYVMPAVLLGIILNTCCYGTKGLKFSAIGMTMPILLLGLFFYARLIGAGDIKLLCSIGALKGFNFILYTMAYSFVLAGIYALILLVRGGNLKRTFINFYLNLKISIFTNDISYLNYWDKQTIRLSPAIAAGTCIQMFCCLLGSEIYV